jgi:hypothetical protein
MNSSSYFESYFETRDRPNTTTARPSLELPGPCHTLAMSVSDGLDRGFATTSRTLKLTLAVLAFLFNMHHLYHYWAHLIDQLVVFYQPFRQSARIQMFRVNTGL